MSEPTPRYDIGTAHHVEEAETQLRAQALMTAAFYRGLIDGGVPEDVAGEALLEWVSGLVRSTFPKSWHTCEE